MEEYEENNKKKKKRYYDKNLMLKPVTTIIFNKLKKSYEDSIKKNYSYEKFRIRDTDFIHLLLEYIDKKDVLSKLDINKQVDEIEKIKDSYRGDLEGINELKSMIKDLEGRIKEIQMRIESIEMIVNNINDVINSHVT